LTKPQDVAELLQKLLRVSLKLLKSRMEREE
jgi:hypothetical protein